MQRIWPLIRRLAIPLCIVLSACASPQAGATDVRFVGSVGYSPGVGFVLLNADEIHNFASSGSSGPLRMEFWATAAPFSGSFAGGYQLAVYPVAPLAAGTSQLNVYSGPVPYAVPPSGQWYVAMVLTEYTGSGTNGGYTLTNYLDFPTPIYGYGGTDSTAPTASIASPAGGTVSGVTTVSVNASDNVGVTRVDLLVNGTVVASDSAAPWQFSWDTHTVSDGAVQLKAIAYDAANNAGASPVVTVTVSNAPPPPPPDTTPPTASITSPTGGTVSGTVPVSVNASDNVGVARVDLLVNGQTVGSDTSAPYQFSWNSTSVANGTAQLKAVAYDAAGNSGQSAILTLSVSNTVTPPPDTTPPTASITSPTGGTASGIVTVFVNASDKVGVARVQLAVNGQVIANAANAPWQFSWDSRSVSNGSAQLKAVAYDAAGNTATSPIVTVNVHNTGSPHTPRKGSAIEYYNASLDHYFISASEADIDALDSGRFAGWARTGQTFTVYLAGEQDGNPVCRFYLPPGYGDSHFFSASSDECAQVAARYPYFAYETPEAFRVELPDSTTGACPVGTTPVYRVWNDRVDTNHRYTTSRTSRDQMVAEGYVAEGYGPDAVIMCAPQ